MAYGNLKADNLIYDDNGTDTVVPIAHVAGKAPLASPTFTGTVAIPNIANLETAVAANTAKTGNATHTGDVTGATALTIADDAVVTAKIADDAVTAAKLAVAYAPLAAPALTGTATAVNLTLSGDLTVNGTTTTVNSTNTTITDNLLELNSGAGSNANDCGILIERGSTGDNAIIAWDESADKFTVGTTTGTASSTGNITIAAAPLVASTVEDSKGDVRSIPQNTQGSTYTLVAGDAGKHILASGTVTVPNSVFSAGDAVTIVNNTASDLTITKTITTMYMSTDATSANRTLATRGMATILFASGTVAYISGAGLS